MEHIDYEKIFKATFEPEKLKELTDRWDNDEDDSKYTREELASLPDWKEGGV